MRENVIISYRGANYELGQWPHGYGIWSGGSQQSQPLESWPATPEGWSAAWYRFAAMEAPGTIAPVSQPAATWDESQLAATRGESQPAATQGESQPAATRDEVFFGSLSLGQPTAATAGPAQMPSGQPSAAPAGYGQPAYGQPGVAARGFGQADAAPVALSGGRSRLAAALLGVGVVLGIIGLFPGYLAGASLASQPPNLWPHLIYLAAWSVSAVVILRGASRVGALAALGISTVTFGLFFADVGTAMADGWSLAGAGMWLTMIGWLACAAGSLVAFGRWPRDWPRHLRGRDVAAAAALIIAGLGVALTFAPSWDSFTLTTPTGFFHVETAGNAFANPGPVIFGDVAVMVALFAVVIIAALWRPGRIGWALAAGAAVPMVGQVVSAIIQVSEKTSPAQFGISPSQAAGAGLKITNGLTAWFWAYLAFLILLLIATAWLARNRDAATPVQTSWTQPAMAAAGVPGGPFAAGSQSVATPGYPPPGTGPAQGIQQAETPPTDPADGRPAG